MAPKPAGVGLRKPTHSKAAKEKGTTRALPMKPPVMKAEEVEPPVIRPQDEADRTTASRLRAEQRHRGEIEDSAGPRRPIFRRHDPRELVVSPSSGIVIAVFPDLLQRSIIAGIPAIAPILFI